MLKGIFLVLNNFRGHILYKRGIESMGRIKIIIFSFIMILIVVIIGNYIHLVLVKEDDEDTYLKKNEGNFAVLIEVDMKRLSLIDLDNNEIIKEYPIATGKAGSPTPLGSFKIIEKARWGGGFGSRWMRINVPWGRYGIHGTNKPGTVGYNASAGCIRMRNSDVEELYDFVKEGSLVTITNGVYGPFANGFRDLRPGDRGADVQEVQKRLKQKGYYSGAIDGIYGEEMKRGVLKFLKDNKIPVTDKIGYDIYEKLDIILMD